MAYLGNTAANRFVAPKAATQFSGDGSTTTFTLDHAVGSDEDILVSVDGVIQEPSVAYAVSNGTTLTFTAAPSSNSGNNIFVYYLFRTVGTVSHPSNNALTATNGTFTGTLDVTGNVGIGTTSPDGTLHVHSASAGSVTPQTSADDLVVENSGNGGISLLTPDANRSAIVFGHASDNHKMQIRHDGGTSLSQIISDDALTFNVGDGTERMRIDANGHITKPTQPAFLVTKSGNQTNITAGGAAQTITFETEVFDQNDDFSSNTFTAPVTGRYQLQFILSVSQIDLDATQINFRLATSNRNIQFFLDPKVFDTDSGFFPLSISALADMDANDTCIIQLVYDGGSQTDVAQESHFSGYLVC